MPAKSYRDLVAWNKAFDLALGVYEETKYFPMEEKYGITAQLRRACVSIPSNIAEGEGRKSASEFRRYLFIALGSLKEAETQILLSNALGYLKPGKADKLLTQSDEVGRLLTGLIKSIAPH
jgi:four helix bundle protein